MMAAAPEVQQSHATVSISVQFITGKRLQLEVDPAIDAKALRLLVSEQLGLAGPNSLKLVYQGQALPRTGALQLKVGAVLVATPERKHPPQHIRDAVLSPGTAGTSTENDEDKFMLSPDAPAWEKALAGFLQKKLGCPDLLMVWLFLIRPLNLLLLGLCIALAPLAERYELGPVFIITCLIAAIFSNLGQRRTGEASAYSIFNPGVQRLPGQLDAEQVAEQIRQGQI